MSDTTITDAAIIEITPSAMETVLGIRAEEADPEALGLRIEITGTKGVDFTYDLAFDELANAVDDGAELHEFAIGVLGNEACDGRLAAARRAPEDAAAHIASPNGVAQGTTRSQEMLLPDTFLQRAGTHAGRQRLGRSEQ